MKAKETGIDGVSERRRKKWPFGDSPSISIPFPSLVSSPGGVIPRAGKKEMGMLDLP